MDADRIIDGSDDTLTWCVNRWGNRVVISIVARLGAFRKPHDSLLTVPAIRNTQRHVVYPVFSLLVGSAVVFVHSTRSTLFSGTQRDGSAVVNLSFAVGSGPSRREKVRHHASRQTVHCWSTGCHDGHVYLDAGDGIAYAITSVLVIRTEAVHVDSEPGYADGSHAKQTEKLLAMPVSLEGARIRTSNLSTRSPTQPISFSFACANP